MTAAPNASDRPAWPEVRKLAPDLTEKQARNVIATRLKTGLLRKESYTNPARRQDEIGLFVTDSLRPK